MRKFLRLPLLLLLLVAALGACRSSTSETEAAVASEQKVAEPTVVYLVRHAEKDISNPSDQDPDLTTKGKARAEALRALLNGQEIDALYATKYLRTISTLKPLADERKLEIRRYEGHDFSGLKQRLLQEHRGQTVVVAGHSNTLLPIIESFGAKRPISDISEQQYDFLFKLTIDPEDNTAIEVSEFSPQAK